MQKILTLGATLILAGCQYFSGVTPTTLQGNAILPETVKQLHVGLTKEQVRYLFGYPMLPGSANRERWEYMYTFQSGYQPLSQRHMVLFFQRGQLHHWRLYDTPKP